MMFALLRRGQRDAADRRRSFGRIEIRFSCCDSQPTMFMNRSRLPWMPSAAVGGEIRIADHDDARFRFRRVGARRASASRSTHGADTAAAIDDRALLVALRLVERHLAAASAGS
mgnify:CR=1 FL=1